MNICAICDAPATLELGHGLYCEEHYHIMKEWIKEASETFREYVVNSGKLFHNR